MTDEKSFAEKYASKNQNTVSELIKKKEQQNMTTQATNLNQSMNQSPSLDNSIKSSKSDLIYLVKGIDDNRQAWYYVLVERLKVSLFLKALNDEIIHLDNYGEVLHSAYGENPPEEITNALKAEYGIK
jgi:hypothetical protein